MSKALEQQPMTALSMQAALLELARSSRTSATEITPDLLPCSFEFTQGALDYGYAQVKRGEHIFNELERSTETEFSYRITPGAGEFELAEEATDPGASRTEVTVLEDGMRGVSHMPAEVTRREERAMALQRLRRMFHILLSGSLSKFSPANISAIEAHTHPPVRKIDAVSSAPGSSIEPVLVPLYASVPSNRDILLVTHGERKPQLVFSPGGFSILVVPTDRTPKLTPEQRLQKEEALFCQLDERSRVMAEYVEALGGKEIGPNLEAVLRDMYRDQPNVSKVPARELFAHYYQYALSGDPHAILFNPVMHFAMRQIGALIEESGAVGYYNIAAANGNVFSRFTNWTA